MARRQYRSNGFDERDLESAVSGFLRLDRRLQLFVVALLVVGGITAAAVYYHEQHRHPAPASGGIQTGPPPASVISTPNMLLGNPSGATADRANRNNYLIAKPYFSLSYNDANGT